jgi:predicted DNA-binding protein (MmcQ/YjbR family)
MKSPGQVLTKVRAACLALPETRETSSWGHPNFRAGKRTFATFERVDGRPSIAFRLDPDDVERLLSRKQFFATPYGRGQWVSVWADRSLDWRIVGDLLQRSYHVVALQRMITALENASSRPSKLKR